MPTADQLSATATKRHAELMKSTDQKRITDYDAKHGAGAYSKKLQEKLNNIYSTEKAEQMTQQAKLGTMNPNVSTPAPPSGGGSNVKVVRAPSSNSKDTNQQSSGGSEVDAAPTGNGNKAKWNILGIPMPF